MTIVELRQALTTVYGPGFLPSLDDDGFVRHPLLWRKADGNVVRIPFESLLGTAYEQPFYQLLSRLSDWVNETIPYCRLDCLNPCDQDCDVEYDMADYPELWFNWQAVQETSDSAETLKKKLLVLFEMLDKDLVVIFDAYNNDQNRKKEEQLTKLLKHIAKQHSRSVEFIPPALAKREIKEDPSSAGRWRSTSFGSNITLKMYPQLEKTLFTFFFELVHQLNPAPHGLDDQEIPYMQKCMAWLSEATLYAFKRYRIAFSDETVKWGVDYFLGYCDRGGPVSLRGVGHYAEGNDFIIGSECVLDLERFFPVDEKEAACD